MQVTTDDFTLNSILDGSAVLFVGAGVSFLSKNQNDDPLPNGEQLKDELHTKTDTKRIFAIEKISNFYVKKFGSARLYDYLTKALLVSFVDKDLVDFYKLPWRRIYTTNYDNGIEFSRRSTRGRASFTLSDYARDIPDGAVVHINGSIENVSPQTIADDLRLTDYSYATSNFEAHKEWSQFFLNDLRVARAIIFVGYSLADLDIARLLLSSALQSKTIFCIAPDADEVEIATLEPFGKVDTHGIKNLFSLIGDAKKTFKKSDLPPSYLSIAEINSEQTRQPPRPVATKILEQLVYGTISFPEIVSDAKVVGSTPFNIPRTRVKPLAQGIVRGDLRDMAIVGDIASGKTFAALQVATTLIAAGYRVYWILDGRKLESDLDKLSQVSEKICLIVDGYGNHLDVVRNYVRRRPSTHALVVTERSATHEVVWPLLREHLPSSNVPEIVLDSLNDEEIAGFEELINFSGLWSIELAGRSPGQRREYIANPNALNRSLYRLLLEVLKSEKVKSEIGILLAPLRDDPDARRFFATAFIVSIFGYNFWINDWQSFYGIKNIRDTIRKYSEQIRHFVIIDASAIRPRTGVASLYMLQNYVDDETIIECLVDIYQTATINRDGDSEYKDAQYRLIRYNVVEPLFSDRNKLTMLVRYFKEIRSIGETRNNPDYWLQLGIASTIASDFPGADIAFKNAYARERAKAHPNLVRIDNYFARFQLEKAAWLDESSEAFVLFRAGIALLLKQIFKDDNRHYPFKAGRALSGLAIKHFRQWTDAEKRSFLGSCRTLLDSAQAWVKKNRHGQEDVSALIRETTLILKSLETAS